MRKKGLRSSLHRVGHYHSQRDEQCRVQYTNTNISVGQYNCPNLAHHRNISSGMLSDMCRYKNTLFLMQNKDAWVNCNY